MRLPARRIGIVPSLSLGMLFLLFALLAVAGGASREDALGQVFVRAGASALAAFWVLAGGRINGPIRPVAILLGVASLLPALQLVPLPPAIWTALPGRSVYMAAASLSGLPQPWRPLAIVPDATVNALHSLIVPVAALLFVGGCRIDERPAILTGLFALILFSAFLSLAQFSGAGMANPLINARDDAPGGVFANRNHQALLLAIGCLVAPAWALMPSRPAAWRLWTALGCLALLLLVILATGSRAGLLIGALALLIAVPLVVSRLRPWLRGAPRWLWPAVLAGGAVVITTLVMISIGANRAASLQRLVALDAGQDMRRRALPVVLDMTRIYFPVGSGYGGFENLFHLHEPMRLLKPTNFNQAHDDLLQIVLEGGAAGIAGLFAACLWWGSCSIRAWRTADALRPRLGSSMILLMLIASAFDYPLRTPLMMAVLVVAAVFLAEPTTAGGSSRSALRARDGPV